MIKVCFSMILSLSVHMLVMMALVIYRPKINTTGQERGFIRVAIMDTQKKTLSCERPPPLVREPIKEPTAEKEVPIEPEAQVRGPKPMAHQSLSGSNGSEENRQGHEDPDLALLHTERATSHRDPQLIINPVNDLIYPARAKRLRIEGVVRLVLTVSSHGLVNDAKVISGPRFGLRKAALAHARRLVFSPATDSQGVSKGAQVFHDVIFRLKETVDLVER